MEDRLCPNEKRPLLCPWKEGWKGLERVNHFPLFSSPSLAPDFPSLPPSPSLSLHPFANDLACLHIVTYSLPGHSSAVGLPCALPTRSPSPPFPPPPLQPRSLCPTHLFVPSLTWRIGVSLSHGHTLLLHSSPLNRVFLGHSSTR